MNNIGIGLMAITLAFGPTILRIVSDYIFIKLVSKSNKK